MAVLEKSKQSAMSSATVAKAEASAPSGIKSKGPTVEESKKPGKSGDSRAKSSVGGKTKQPVSVGSVPASKAAIDEDSGPPLVASNKEKRHRDEVALKVRQSAMLVFAFDCMPGTVYVFVYTLLVNGYFIVL